MRYINIPVFLISLAIGIFFVYINNPLKNVVVFPTPENENSLQYKDNANMCHSFKSTEVSCPDNKELIVDYGVQ